MIRSIVAAVTVTLSLAGGLWAQDTPTVMPLWADRAPGATGDKDADKPTLTLWPAPAEKATGAAVVICPGGGYGHLAVGHEGKDVAAWLNSFGVSGYMLKYRIAPYKHPIPLGDAQRAVRIVRANAEKWKIDPARIGILGFSAGGHLASSAATHFDSGQADAADPIDRASCRPDFAVLVYPVISMGRFTHGGSKNNLLGKNPDQTLVDLMSNEKQVTAQTPPTFLIHTGNDGAVPVENSLAFFAACRAAKIPAELHVFESGPHGFGLGKPDKPYSAWPKLCEEWMRGRKLLEKK